MTDYRNTLKQQLAERTRVNPRYSLRAFARDLGVSASIISEVMNRKHGLSEKKAELIASKMGLSKEECAEFVLSVRALDGRSKEIRESSVKILSEQASQMQSIHQLSLDAFRVVADWYHFALIEYLQLKNASHDPYDIAQGLGVPLNLIQDALIRLINLEMIEKKRVRFRVVKPFYLSPHGTPSEAIRTFHRQILEKALHSLTLQSLEQREFRNLVFAVSRKRIPHVKKKIQEFVRSVNEEETREAGKDSIYNLSVQLFELTPQLKSTGDHQ